MQAALQEMEAAPFEESSEFNALFDKLNYIIDEDFLYALGMYSTHKTIRSRGGRENQVTHWTRESWPSDEGMSERLQEELDHILPYHLGSGSFAHVFQCPWDETKAIKIGTGLDNDGDIGMDGWLDYAAWCISNPRDLVVPVIHNLILGDCFYVALLDKYDMTVSMADFELNDDDAAIVNRRMESLKAVLQRDEEFNPEEHDKEYYDIAKQLEEQELYINDGHDENFMVRREDLAVFLTDPSAEECSRDAWDLLGNLGIRRS